MRHCRAAGKKADALHVLDGAREQLPSFTLVMEREGKHGQLVLDLVAQIVSDVLRGFLAENAFIVAEDAAQRGQQEQSQDGGAQQGNILLTNAAVDDPADELWNEQAEAIRRTGSMSGYRTPVRCSNCKRAREGSKDGLRAASLDEVKEEVFELM
jgi:hypothetical protein